MNNNREITPEQPNLPYSQRYNMYREWSSRFQGLGLTGVIGIPNTTFEEWLLWFKKYMEIFSDEFNKLAENVYDIADVTYTVGSKGDFQNLNDCFQHIDNLIKRPKSIKVLLLSDYIMSEQLLMLNKDYFKVSIYAENDTVLTGDLIKPQTFTYTGFTTFDYVPYFYGLNSNMPQIHFKLKNVSTINNSLYGYVADNSNLAFYPKGGASDFTSTGLFGLNGSKIKADYCDFSNNGNRNMQQENVQDQNYYGDGILLYSSALSGIFMTINRNGSVGLNISHNSVANVDNTVGGYNGHHALMSTTSSNVSAQGAKFTHTTDDNVVAYAGSSIDFRHGDSSNSHTAYGLIATRGGIINFDYGVSNGSALAGIMSNRSSIIDATKATVSNNTERGLIASNDGAIDFTSGIAENNGTDGVQAAHGGQVQMRAATVSNSGRDGLLAYAGRIYAHESTIKNSKRHGVDNTRGGYVDIAYGTVDTAGGEGLLAYGTEINAFKSIIKNATNNLALSTRGGKIVINESTLSTATKNGLQAYGGTIFANLASISDITLNPLLATNGGDITAYEIKIDGTKNALGKHKDINSQKASIIKIDANNKYTLSVIPNDMTKGTLILQEVIGEK